MADLDQSGIAFQDVKVWLGPTLGWIMQQVRPTQGVTVGGTTNVLPGTSVVLVSVAATVTLNLPQVAVWVKETHYQPATGFERAVWIKDIGGNAAAFNITIHPFSGDTIDTLPGDVPMIVDRQIIRLYPLNDLTGWYIG